MVAYSILLLPADEDVQPPVRMRHRIRPNPKKAVRLPKRGSFPHLLNKVVKGSVQLATNLWCGPLLHIAG